MRRDDAGRRRPPPWPEGFGVLTSNPTTPSLSPSTSASTRFDRISREPSVAAGGFRRFRAASSGHRGVSSRQGARGAPHAIRQRAGWDESGRAPRTPPARNRPKKDVVPGIVGLAGRPDLRGLQTNHRGPDSNTRPLLSRGRRNVSPMRRSHSWAARWNGVSTGAEAP